MGKIGHSDIGNEGTKVEYESADHHLIGGVAGLDVLGSSTYVVAASGAFAASKARANAVCDATEDESEIQVGIDAILNSGSPTRTMGLLRLTEHIFIIENEISAYKHSAPTKPDWLSYLSVVGAGRGQTLLRWEGGSAASAILIDIDGTGSPLTDRTLNVHLRDFGWDFMDDNNPAVGLRLKGVGYSTFTRIGHITHHYASTDGTHDNHPTKGLYAEGCVHLTFDDCWFEGSGHGVYIYAPTAKGSGYYGHTIRFLGGRFGGKSTNLDGSAPWSGTAFNVTGYRGYNGSILLLNSTIEGCNYGMQWYEAQGGVVICPHMEACEECYVEVGRSGETRVRSFIMFGGLIYNTATDKIGFKIGNAEGVYLNTPITNDTFVTDWLQVLNDSKVEVGDVYSADTGSPNVASGAQLRGGKFGNTTTYTTKTDDYAVTEGDSGIIFAMATDAKTFTLPATKKSLRYRFINTGANGNNPINISPNASDKIQGGGLGAGTDNKDLINTKATSKYGDMVELEGDGADGWLITQIIGTWAFEA